MKKHFKVVVMAAFALVTVYNVHKAQTEVKLSDAQLKNVEALANNEVGPDRPDCEEKKKEECKMLVTYPDGSYGFDSLVDYQKKPGWL